MELISIKDIGSFERRNVFKSPSAKQLIVSIFTSGLAAAAVISCLMGALPLGPAIIMGVLSGLIGMSTFNRYRRSLSPENWLVSTHQKGLYMQVRSFMNTIATVDRPVFSIDYGDIKSASVKKLALKFHIKKKNGSRRSTITNYYVDLEVEPGRLADLSAAIRQEYAIKYDGTASLAYPVSTPNNHTIRLSWRGVSPSKKKFLDLLKRWGVDIGEKTSETNDYTNLESLDEEVLKEKLIEMIGYGEKMKAEDMIRSIYKCGIKERKEILDGLLR